MSFERARCSLGGLPGAGRLRVLPPAVAAVVGYGGSLLACS